MTVVVRLASVLRAHAGGRSTLTVEVPPPVTIRSILDAVDRAHPSLGRRLRDEAGHLRVHVNLFIGADNVRDAGGLDAPVPDGAEVSVLPAVSGG